MRYHEPVLLSESVAGLKIKPDGIYVDVTFGGGGHSREILKKLTTGKLIAFDKDKDAMSNLPDNKSFQLIRADFSKVQEVLAAEAIEHVDGLLADLGISSHQIDTPERGFSTRSDGVLDMRMDTSQELTAEDIVNEYEESDLIAVLRNYGELKRARSIAKAVIAARMQSPISTTGELKDVISRFGPRGKEQKFYAQVFQALRIEVNGELDSLKALLEQSGDILKKGGRLSVISYHSLEDRLVKNYIAKGKFEGELDKDFYGNPQRILKAINRKPITASGQEIEKNSRARSAKLRIAEKI